MNSSSLRERSKVLKIIVSGLQPTFLDYAVIRGGGELGGGTFFTKSYTAVTFCSAHAYLISVGRLRSRELREIVESF